MCVYVSVCLYVRVYVSVYFACCVCVLCMYTSACYVCALCLCVCIFPISLSSFNFLSLVSPIGSMDGTIRIWDINQLQVRSTFLSIPLFILFRSIFLYPSNLSSLSLSLSLSICHFCIKVRFVLQGHAEGVAKGN